MDFLKIDDSLVCNIMYEQEDLVLVQAINQFAEVFDMQTIAEFVENKKHHGRIDRAWHRLRTGLSSQPLAHRTPNHNVPKASDPDRR